VGDKSLQDTYAPENQCFGCGPANPKGLRIKSYTEGDELVAHWSPEEHHQAFGNILNGGICGTLLDCHSNWCAAYTLLQTHELTELPTTVTAYFNVSLRAPTPMDKDLIIRAKAIEIGDDRVKVQASIEADGNVTATCKGLFVSVKEGHPAFFRW